MFSANENLQLRQHKRRIVEQIEACIPDDILDLGVNVMVMQVACQAPGCVPLETAVIIVFPKIPAETNGSSDHKELLPGLPESAGGSFKTKILKPMAGVTQQDVLEALPPEFEGGLRTLERIALGARDVMLAQITQLFDETQLDDRKAMALYLQEALNDFMDRECQAPEYGEPFGPIASSVEKPSIQLESSSTNGTLPSRGNLVLKRPGIAAKQNQAIQIQTPSTTMTDPKSSTHVSAPEGSTPQQPSIQLQEATKTMPPSRGNLVLRRPASTKSTASGMPKPVVATAHQTASSAFANHQHDNKATTPAAAHILPSSSSMDAARRMRHDRALAATSGSSDGTLRRLVQQQQHSPAIRRPACPCCDPDNPANVADQMMSMF